MAETLDLRYPKYCFRSELQINLDNVTILRCYLLQQAWVRLGKLIYLDGLGNYTLMTLSLQ